jgi:hypothetical protein
LNGTRKAILEEIENWVNRSSFPTEGEEGNEPCVYWLHGVAGCGKSAIASTIARRFRSLKRCVSFFFDGSKQLESGPNRMFSTISRALADLDPLWRELLIQAAEESRELRTTLNIQRQFENFILKPAKEFRPIGPIVIVIDALNESGSKKERAPLLTTLERLNELKSFGHFRFLVTSRPDQDIREAFSNKSWIICKDLMEIDISSTDGDIRSYVNSMLSSEQDLIDQWPDKPWLDLFVDRAEHLFQWAFVACTFVKGVEEHVVDPVKRYMRLSNQSSSRLRGLDLLYTTVLRSIFQTEDDEDDMVERFRTVLGRVLSAKEPLSLSALTELRSNNETTTNLRIIVRPLGSLLRGVGSDDKPIKPLHVSFLDYLRDPGRSGEFHILSGSEDKTLVMSTLRTMNKLLRYNICELESSYLHNRDIRGVSEKIRQHIPEHLSYSCRYFGEHLVASGDQNPEVEDMIEEFLYSKFLFWLEVLSLLDDMHQAAKQLLAMQTWLQV